MTEYLHSLLKALESYYPKSVDLSLHRMELLLKVMGNPHHKLPPTIHVAGTNGKGSTISFMKSILETAGYKVHSYTSPHLIDFNERICLWGKPISGDSLEKYLKTVQHVIQKKSLEATFFEATTAAAFLAFSEISADFLLLETGLGGRLDATNVIKNPLACVITPISHDHEDFLGKTLEKITREKLGIVKPDATVIVGPQSLQVLEYCSSFHVVNNKILRSDKEWTIGHTPKGFSLHYLNNETYFNAPGLLGSHQYENAATALMALSFLNLPFSVLQKGLEKATWPGRLQKLNLSPPSSNFVYIDGAHNIGGMSALANFIKQTDPSGGPLAIGLSVLSNRNPCDILAPLENLADEFFHIDCNNPQFHPFSAFPSYVKKTVSFNNLRDFLLEKENPSRIFLTGSLHLMGNILSAQSSVFGIEKAKLKVTTQ